MLRGMILENAGIKVHLFNLKRLNELIICKIR